MCSHMRWLLAFVLLAVTAACSAAWREGPNGKPAAWLTDTPADVVTGSMSAPSSPGVNGPSRPGGPGGGGGTLPDRK
jgi:hypothetical protein